VRYVSRPGGIVGIEARAHQNVPDDLDRSSMKQTQVRRRTVGRRVPVEDPVTGSNALEVFALDPAESLVRMAGCCPLPQGSPEHAVYVREGTFRDDMAVVDRSAGQRRECGSGSVGAGSGPGRGQVLCG
jgi:hypothetical protein